MGNGTNLSSLTGPSTVSCCAWARTLPRRSAGRGGFLPRAAFLLSRLAVVRRGAGLCRLEFAHGIPGTLGGAVSEHERRGLRRGD
jgi:UDP-N-acetylenolpyruvoylglucosamine reductase